MVSNQAGVSLCVRLLHLIYSPKLIAGCRLSLITNKERPDKHLVFQLVYCVRGSLKNLCHFEMGGGLANADVIRGSLNADSC